MWDQESTIELASLVNKVVRTKWGIVTLTPLNLVIQGDMDHTFISVFGY